MPKATAKMLNRAPVPPFCALLPAVAAFPDGEGVTLGELDVAVAWPWMPLVAPVAMPVAEGVLLMLRVTLWAAQSFDAKSSDSEARVC